MKSRDPDGAELLLAAGRHHRLHPLALERLLEEEYGPQIAPNRPRATLNGAGLVVDSPKKRRRRRWVCFERRHSNALWQMDYSKTNRGEHLLGTLDEASRLVVGWARTPTATAEVAWATCETAGHRDGFPKQILTPITGPSSQRSSIASPPTSIGS